ncbi:ornithine carbamoyltransferase [Desulfogranum japonicum]|uniref:ornithine carbamoyltransferase n=1 Tax=Desulfogranum japonicum TaxID=231447 RepID=UPI0004159566|nr:ornithine carbamoyltransferase [Desulfogranum japonicum]
MTNHLLALSDFSKQQLQSLIVRAIMLKNESLEGVRHQQLAGRSVCLLFEKPSTRTRVSFESAMYRLGGQVIFMSAKESQLGRGEPLKDTARVLSRYVDGIVVRTFGQEVVEELSKYATVPVINALTDLYHPCQVLSDIMTVIEKKGAPENLKIVWIGDGNNMANSWIEAASVFGFSLTLSCPEGYEPNAAVLEAARKTGVGDIRLVSDPAEAMEDADVVNVDVWASMGQESEQEKRVKLFQPYQLNAALMGKAKDDAIVLHCLPAHRGEEITEDILEGTQSVVFDQAENKMHIHKAILELFIGGSTEVTNQ